MDWENHLEKNSDPKIEKNSENRVKLPHVNKKPLPRNRIFVQTPFSHSTLKLEREKNHATKPLAFSLHFLFRRDQNHYSNMTSKIMKMCEQILKKRQRPNTIQILWIVKSKSVTILYTTQWILTFFFEVQHNDFLSAGIADNVFY